MLVIKIRWKFLCINISLLKIKILVFDSNWCGSCSSISVQVEQAILTCLFTTWYLLRMIGDTSNKSLWSKFSRIKVFPVTRAFSIFFWVYWSQVMFSWQILLSLYFFLNSYIKKPVLSITKGKRKEIFSQISNIANYSIINEFKGTFSSRISLR